MALKRALPWMAGVGLLAALVLVGKAVLLARQGDSPQVRYATGVARRGAIEVDVTGTGSAAFAQRQAVFPEVDGVVAAVPVQVGDAVRQGQVLVTLTNDQMVAAGNVVAPAAGRVVDLRVKEGDVVQKGAVLANLVDNRAVEFVVPVLAPERARIRPGQAALVSVDNFDGQVAGRVLSVGDHEVAGQNGMLYYKVRVGVENPGLWRAGMTGYATIEADGGPVTRAGSVDWSGKQPLVAPMAGRVDRLDVVEGQAVRAGERLAHLVNASLSPEELRDKLTLRAPFDGTVVALNVRPGDQLAAGTKAGAIGEPVVVAGGGVVVTVAVDEMDVAKVQVGQKAEVTFPALPGRVYSGTVSRIGLEGKTQNGVTTYDVEVQVDRPEGIRAGMTATASIRVAAKQDALLVPVEAVVDTPQGPVVRVLAGGRPREVPVRIGLRNDRVAEVLSGLRAGDEVVLAEYDPNALPQGFGPGRFGPGGFPAGGLMGPRGGRPGGPGTPGGGGRQR